MSEPFPDPNNNLPNNITGRRYDVPLRKAPAANVEDPSKQRVENRKTPTLLPSLSIRNPAQITTTAFLKVNIEQLIMQFKIILFISSKTGLQILASI